MYRKSIAKTFIMPLLLLAAPASAEGPKDLTLILFGAHWCAPCRAEVRDLPALADAAEPARLLIAWLDRKPAGLPANIGGRWSVLTPPDARRLWEGLGDKARGLPTAVLLDDERPCAEWHGGVTPQEIGKMKASCAAR
jgi:thiol-disulfide isomerase/thioredoxin